MLLNIGRKPKITLNFQHMLYFSGLRGAMAFALAIRNTLSEARQMFLTATALVVIVSVIAVGGSVSVLLQWLGIPVGVEDEIEPLQGRRQANYSSTRPNQPLPEPGPPQESGLADTTPRQAPPKIEKAWLARIWGGFDTKYMKPLLTNSHPTLIETMPKFCGPFARLMTTAEQLTEMYYRTRDDSDADLCIADEFEGYNVMVEPSQQRLLDY
ncbi:sodium/hydrogen exchanger 7-like isoform X1 [Artemia franciscana]|uniref:sodium/hydrogen exchanger 7-like isoform X1 n=1 Tax=Artemia franciscana TaxID=6661 RepID=UPI0032DB2C90